MVISHVTSFGSQFEYQMKQEKVKVRHKDERSGLGKA